MDALYDRPLFMNGQVVFNTHIPTTIRVIEHERFTCLFINNGRTMNLSTEEHSILALPLLRQRCNAVVESLGDAYYGFFMKSVTSMFMATARHQRFYPSLVLPAFDNETQLRPSPQPLL